MLLVDSKCIQTGFGS